jgi:tRNA(Ile2) C34 agmatinyltransferase TiaS
MIITAIEKCTDCGRELGGAGDTELRCRRCDVLGRRADRAKLIHQIYPWEANAREIHDRNKMRLNRAMFWGERGQPQIIGRMNYN